MASILFVSQRAADRHPEFRFWPDEFLRHDVFLGEASQQNFAGGGAVDPRYNSAKRDARDGRESLLELSGKHREFESQRQMLDQEIKNLESQLGEAVKHSIGVED